MLIRYICCFELCTESTDKVLWLETNGNSLVLGLQKNREVTSDYTHLSIFFACAL